MAGGSSWTGNRSASTPAVAGVTARGCSASLTAADRVLWWWLAAEDGAGPEQVWFTTDGDRQRCAVLYQVVLLFVGELDPELPVTIPQ
jgi:hypothetical protein